MLFTSGLGHELVVFHTRVGELRVSKCNHGYRLDIPILPPEEITVLPKEISFVFETAPEYIFRNFENIFADLGSADLVRKFVPDLTAIAALGRLGLVVTGQAGDGEVADFVSRYFAPGAGIPEDPVTGSIHATLVPYWAERLKRRKLVAFQASARGGWLRCELTDERVLLEGNAVTFMEATVLLEPKVVHFEQRPILRASIDNHEL